MAIPNHRSARHGYEKDLEAIPLRLGYHDLMHQWKCIKRQQCHSGSTAWLADELSSSTRQMQLINKPQDSKVLQHQLTNITNSDGGNLNTYISIITSI
jgi:hypothetical protein